MDWRRVLGLAVVLAVLFLGLARPWETPPATRGDPDGATHRSRQGQGMQRWSVTQGAYAVEDAGPAEPAVTIPMPASGFCDGPAGPAGYTRPGAGAATVELLRQAAHQEEQPESTVQALVLARKALGEPSAQAAWELAGRAVRQAAGPAGVHAVAGLTARRAGRPFEAAAALTRAVRMEPGVPALERELAEVLALTHRVDDALLHQRRYLEAEPNDWDAIRRARLWEVTQEVEASFVTVQDPFFPVRHDPAVPASRVAVLQQALREALPRAAALLGPLHDPVAVLVYRERADLLATTCAQGWAHAVFDGRMRFQDEEGGLLRRADGVTRLAAHELTHVLHRRHLARPDGWLLEGLARYVAHEEDASYWATLALLQDNGSHIPFSSLMGTLMVLEGAADSAMAYDQSLMMVHWVVDRRGEDGLRALLLDTREDGEAALAAALRMEQDALGADFVRWLKVQPRPPR